MSTTKESSSNPPTENAEATAGTAAPAIASGHEGTAVDQFRSYVQRVRGGEMGMLPAVGGFVVLMILFSVLSPTSPSGAPQFLTGANLANLLTQTASLAMLATGLVFVILLAEIDLSAGVTSGIGMGVFVLLNNQNDVNWIAAFSVSLIVGVLVGSFIGFFVARVGVPSFVVTLGLFLGFQGLQLVLLGDGGTYRIQEPAVLAIMNSNLPVWAGWAMYVLIVLIALGTAFYDRARRLAAGVAVSTMSVLWIRVAAVAVGFGLLVALLSSNRSQGAIPLQGVPIVVPIALAILWVGTQLLDRTRFGLHLYAVGGNPEAARRGGINVARIRMTAFIICSTLAVVAGLFAASRVGSVNTGAGRDTVLSGVAAAVVGGVSLFGGRGRLAQAAVGALVISVITNGLGLLGLPGGVSLLITGGVLVLAATVDALSRKRAGASLART